MNIETIVQLISSGVSALAIIFYFIIWIKVSKKGGSDAFQEILKKIPNYFIMAQGTPGTQLNKVNFILACIKSDCEEQNIKFKEKIAKEAVQKYVEGNK